MECVSEGYLSDKSAFLVIGVPWNEDDSYIIFAVCDRSDYADSFCEQVNAMVGSDIRKVYVSEYRLNSLVNVDDL